MARDLEQLVLTMSADIRRFERQMERARQKTDSELGRVERRAQQTEGRLSRFGSTLGRGLPRTAFAGVEGALQGIAGQSALAGASLGRLSGPLLAVGAAAGGVTLLYGAMRQAAQAADDLVTAADHMYVGVEALQELRHAGETADIEVRNLDAGLQNLQRSIGAVQTGLRARAPTAAFAQLGLSQEDIRRLGTLENILPVIADRLRGVQDVASRMRIAQALGVQDLLPLLERGSGEIARLRAEARQLGLVLDEDVARKAADANEEFRRLEARMRVELLRAFAPVATEAGNATQAIGDMAGTVGEWTANVIRLLSAARNAWAEFQQFRRDNDWADGLYDFAIGGLWRTHGPEGGIAGLMSREAARNRPGQIGNFGVNVDVRNLPPPMTTPLAGTSRSRPRRSRGGGSNDAERAAREAERQEEQRRRRLEDVQDRLLRAELETIEAQDNEGRTIEERAEFQRQRRDLQRQQRDLELQRLVNEYDRSKGLQGISAAERDQLAAANALVDATEDAVARVEERNALQDAAIAVERQLTDMAAEMLTLQRDSARTAAERRRIELNVLEITRAQERREREAQDLRNADLSAEQRARNLADFDRATEARRGSILRSTMGPLEQWRDQNIRSAEQVQEALEQAAVNGLDAFNEGLVDAILNARDLGEAFSNVSKSIIADLLRIAVQQTIIQPLALRMFGGRGGGDPIGDLIQSSGGAFGGGGSSGGWLSRLFGAFRGWSGFAAGGRVRGPGTGTSDSIPARLSDGEYVVNARAASRNLHLLDAINAGSDVLRFAQGGLVGGRGAGGLAVQIHTHTSAPLQVEKSDGGRRIDIYEQGGRAVIARAGQDGTLARGLRATPRHNRRG